MQRVFNLDKWQEIPEGKAIRFNAEQPRVVRIDVNAPDAVRLYLINAANEPHFLARVQGRDVIEFFSSGAFSLASDGQCYIYSVDGDVWTYNDPAPEIFTRIRERRGRNPELEYIVARMQQNMERRLAQQSHEIAAALERRQAAREAQSQPAQPSVAAREEPARKPGAKPARAPAADSGRRDDEA